MNNAVSVLRMYPVFMRVGVAARAQLRTLCRTLRDNVRIITDKNGAQKAIRRAWHRWRLYVSLCLSSPHADISHFRVFSDKFDDAIANPFGIITRALQFLVASFQHPNSWAFGRYAQRFLAKNNLRDIQKHFPLSPRVILHSFHRLRHDDDGIFTVINFDGWADILNYTHVELLSQERDRKVTLRFGGNDWFTVCIPDDASAIRFKWNNFPNVIVKHFAMHLVLHNVSVCRVLNAGLMCDAWVNEALLHSPSRVFSNPVFVEAFFDSSYSCRRLQPDSGVYYTSLMAPPTTMPSHCFQTE